VYLVDISGFGQAMDIQRFQLWHSALRAVQLKILQCIRVMNQSQFMQALRNRAVDCLLPG
jgi:hypothetical protein